MTTKIPTLYKTCKIFLFTAAVLLFAGCNESARTELPDLNTKIGQMLMVGFRGTQITERDPIAEDISKGRIGGVILFNQDIVLKSNVRNIVNPQQLGYLTRKLKSFARGAPLLIAVDQEGGRVARLNPSNDFAETPSAQKLGESANVSLTEAAAFETGKTLKTMGINLNFAPVVDVNVNPENPAIGKLERSYSADAEKVSLHASAYLDGLHKAGILGCIKHFPGHGSAFNDSHDGLTDVTEITRPEELKPFAEIIAAQKCDMIMTAHIFNANLDSVYPATLSDKTINGLLRKKLGYEGVVITDDLQMGAISNNYELKNTVIAAVNAGADILLFGNNLSYDPEISEKVTSIIRKAIEEGLIKTSRIDQSYSRIMQLKQRLNES